MSVGGVVITTQKVLFYTLINTGFEHFLCSNQGFQTRPGVLTRGGERVKGSEVQPGRTRVQPDG